MERKPYRIAGIYDTETTNIDTREGEAIRHRAFPVLFIFNRLRGYIADYEPGASDSIALHRHSRDMLEALESLIDDGIEGGFVPIVCAYNLMFDLQPLLFELSQRYDMRCSAQNRVTVYTIDLLIDDSPVLRFWDTFFLEMNGLAAMGRTCGFRKAEGEWDYDFMRSQETPLTDEEIEYAERDVQVIPAYLRWILETNPHLQESDLGFRVLTKTSLVRQMARHRLANLRIVKENGKRLTLLRAFSLTCKQELPSDYRSYALRKACFRGGFTFTGARFAMVPVRNVASLDVVSMHHAFIDGRYVPVKFHSMRTEILDNLLFAASTYDVGAVLERYWRPVPFAFHCRIRIRNIRIRRGSAFERWGIGLLAMSKFASSTHSEDTSNESTANIAADNAIRAEWRDTCENPMFAFGKLYAADECIVHLNEIEYWNVLQVYEFDSAEALEGEATFRFVKPPDYVSLQSNVLFELKSAMKSIVKGYREGSPYDGEISELLPKSIAEGLRDGTLSEDFVNSYYTSTIKGQFNGRYGTQAQDLYKPEFTMEGGIIDIDAETIATPERFADMEPEKPLVMYTFGQRIVAGSRMHLVIAMELLSSLGSRVDILGGDTDSLKIRCDADVSDSELLEALEPLHMATDEAISFTQRRIRETFPDLASDLESIGRFEVENSGAFYEWHMEAWNKARISYDGKAHITCAGLSRPAGRYTIEDAANDLIARYGFEKAAPRILKFNAWIRPELSHSLGHHVPNIADRFEETIMDHLGNSAYVSEYESIALYPIGRMLGSASNIGNRFTIHYLDDRIDSRVSVLGCIGNEPIFEILDNVATD